MHWHRKNTTRYRCMLIIIELINLLSECVINECLYKWLRLYESVTQSNLDKWTSPEDCMS